jgi:hypothetical protein
MNPISITDTQNLVAEYRRSREAEAADWRIGRWARRPTAEPRGRVLRLAGRHRAEPLAATDRAVA